ncbi:MAG: hypothetical protein L6Q95_07985, partial [Planctomycetes bacterium]|nr:hypothetical protein [Planctomycetota bacterium]
AFPPIRKNLQAESAFRVEAALLALSAAREAPADLNAAARGCLGDKRPAVRAAAAQAFGATARDRRAAARALIAMLDDTEDRVAEAVTATLASHARESIPEMVAALAGASPVRSARLVAALRQLPDDALPAFGAELIAAPPAIRPAVLRAVRPEALALLPAEARNAIARWLVEGDAAVRIAALALVGSGSWPDRADAVRLLRDAAVAKDPQVRAGAVGRLGDLDEAPEALRAACDDPDAAVRMEAACALSRRGEPGPDPLPLCLALLDRLPAAASRIGEMGIRGRSAIPDLVRAAGVPESAAAARDALARLLDAGSPELVLGRSAAFAAAPEALRASVARALGWLAAAQENDGHWDGVRWGSAPICDTGVTGLALLAFLSAGETDTSAAHGAVVRRGLDALVASQRDDGVLGSRATSAFLVQHGIATAALAEAACFSRDSRIARAARDALKFVSLSRNPELGWRYEPRGGENDTFVTTWMVMALKAGEMAGLHRDPGAYEGALRWIDKMTEPNFGQVGYRSAGGYPASPREPGAVETIEPPPLPFPLPRFAGLRESEEERQQRRREEEARDAAQAAASKLRDPDTNQACTAGGVWVRLLTGGGFSSEPGLKGLHSITAHPPAWKHPLAIDECYWHWGALVVAQARGSRAYEHVRERWRDPLERELLSHQAADGSWDPVGIWGRTGGRVFSTAMATLALLAPYAYPEGCFTEDYRRRLYPEAFKLLGR